MTLLSIPFNSDLGFRPVKRTPPASLSSELCRVLHAAVINKTFCQNLLSNPLRSIEAGFCGERFNLDTEDRNRVEGVRASTLEEFSSQLMAGVQPVVVPQIDCLVDRPIS